MLTFDSLAKQLSHFRNFTGLTPTEAEELAALLRPDWEQCRLAKVKIDRRRKVGGGRKLELPEFKDRLLVFLIYAKLYPTYIFLEYLFGIDHATVGRIIQELEPILAATIIINRHHKRIRNLDDLREAIPNLDEVIIDATEQRVARPTKKRARKQHHSGKKKNFTIKTQIMATKQKVILHASDSLPGRTHDYKYFRQTDVPDWLEANPQIKARVDLGYLGANRDYPKANIILPVKRTRAKKELTRSEKIHNTKKAKARIVVENTIANLKKFKLLADTYRNAKGRYSGLFKAVVFLSNFRTLARMPA